MRPWEHRSYTSVNSLVNPRCPRAPRILMAWLQTRRLDTIPSGLQHHSKLAASGFAINVTLRRRKQRPHAFVSAGCDPVRPLPVRQDSCQIILSEGGILPSPWSILGDRLPGLFASLASVVRTVLLRRPKNLALRGSRSVSQGNAHIIDVGLGNYHVF